VIPLSSAVEYRGTEATEGTKESRMDGDGQLIHHEGTKSTKDTKDRKERLSQQHFLLLFSLRVLRALRAFVVNL